MDYLIVLGIFAAILVGLVLLARWATGQGRMAQIGAFVLACIVPFGWIVFLLAFVVIRSRRQAAA